MRAALDALCGAGKWRAYCISLKRCEGRRAAFTAWAAGVDLPFSFWDATDKLDLSGATVKVGGKPSLGAEACRRSHEALYRHCLAQPEPYVFVLEDDAGFKVCAADLTASGDCDAGFHSKCEAVTDFIAAVAKSNLSWAMIQFGYHTAATTQMSLFKPVDKRIFRYDVADQMHAILFKKKTVRELLDLCSQEKSRARPIDGILNIYQTRKVGLCIGPEHSLIHQVDPVSYIWQEAS